MAPHQAHQGRAQPQGPLPGPPPPGFRMRPQGGYPQEGQQPGLHGHLPGQQWQQRAPPGPTWKPGAPEQQHMSLDLGPVRYRSPQEIAEATAWLERYGGGPGLDLGPAAAIAEHEAAVAKAGGHRTPPVSTSRSKRGDASATSRSSSTSRTTSKGWNFASTHTPATVAREGPVCGTSTPATTPDPTPDPTPRAPSPQPSSRTLSSTSEPEVIDVQLQYDESSRLQNEHLALRPKAKPRLKVRHDPRHGAMRPKTAKELQTLTMPSTKKKKKK